MTTKKKHGDWKKKALGAAQMAGWSVGMGAFSSLMFFAMLREARLGECTFVDFVPDILRSGEFVVGRHAMADLIESLHIVVHIANGDAKAVAVARAAVPEPASEDLN